MIFIYYGIISWWASIKTSQSKIVYVYKQWQTTINRLKCQQTIRKQHEDMSLLPCTLLQQISSHNNIPQHIKWWKIERKRGRQNNIPKYVVETEGKKWEKCDKESCQCCFNVMIYFMKCCNRDGVVLLFLFKNYRVYSINPIPRDGMPTTAHWHCLWSKFNFSSAKRILQLIDNK